jgi:hypothetical protein
MQLLSAGPGATGLGSRPHWRQGLVSLLHVSAINGATLWLQQRVNESVGVLLPVARL